MRFDRTFERATLAAFAAGWSGRFEPQTEGHAGGRAVERLLDGPVPELVFPARSQTVDLEHRGEPLPPRGQARRRLARTAGRGDAPSRLGGSAPAAPRHSGDGRRPARPRVGVRVGGPGLAAPREGPRGLDGRPIVFRDRLLVEAGLRLDASAGAAEGATQDVSWTTLSPASRRGSGSRAQAADGLRRLRRLPPPAPAGAARVRRSERTASRGPPLGRLERRRPLRSAERGVLVARVGPGGYARRHRSRSQAAADEGARGGPRASPGHDWLVRLTGFDRRERDLLESVDVGVPISGYTVRYLPDPAGDILGPQDDQLLPVYDRKPETFGLDRYLLTNPAGHAGRHRGVELRVEKTLAKARAPRRGHRFDDGDRRRQPRLPRPGERSGSRRRALRRSQRGHPRQWPELLRPRLHDQGRGRLSRAGRLAAGACGAVPGRPAVRPLRGRARPRARTRDRARHAARPDHARAGPRTRRGATSCPPATASPTP